MEYLGADLALKDLAYVNALVASAKRDCDAANASNLTTGILALITDKMMMSQEAMKLIQGSAIAKANPVLAQLIINNYAAAATKYEQLMKMTPKPDTSAFTPPPYSAQSIFSAPPAPPASLTLTEVAKNTYAPATISWDEMMKKATAVMYSRGPAVAASTNKPGALNIKTVGIVAAAAAAAYFMLKG